MSVGKTIARIEESPTNEYGRAADDLLLIHFTDGTALEVSGSSWEEVSLGWREVDAPAIRRFARAAQGRREAKRLARLRREELASVSDEERARRRAVRRAKMGPFGRALEDEFASTIQEMVRDTNRMMYGTDTLGLAGQSRGHARRS